MWTILLIILILLVVGGGFGYSGGSYRNQGFGLGAILLVVLLVMLFSGRM